MTEMTENAERKKNREQQEKGTEMMEKKVYELKVDEEFSTMFPPLEADEYRGLEESLKQDGCTDPLIVWHGVIIDGNNRFKICMEHGIPFLYEEKDDLPDRGAVKVWMAKRQLARRNLNAYQKSRMALMLEPKLREEARERQVKAGKEKLSQNSDEAPNERRTDKKVADIAGVSRDTISKVKKIEAAADDETKQKLENGEISIHKAYTDLARSEVPGNVSVEGKKGIHVEGRMQDVPDSFLAVKGLLEDVAKNYLVSLEHILLQYTSGMVTEEHNNEIRSMFRGTAQEANNIIRKRIEEITEVME